MEPDLGLLLRGETDRVEWKQKGHDNDVLHAVCAMANDLGGTGNEGYVVLGVAPNGAVVGLAGEPRQHDEEQQLWSSRLHSTKILPTPTFDLLMREVDGKHILIIRVAPSIVPPVVEVNGVAYVRSGTTTYRARAADLQRLRERRPEAAQPFDLRPVRGALIDDLGLSELRDEYNAARLSDADPDTFPEFDAWLRQRDLGRSIGDQFVPNAGAILVYGKSPQSFFPGAVVEFVRYSGSDIDADIGARKTITGTLGNQLEVLSAQIDAHIVSRQSTGETAKLEFGPDYPTAALLELARNLIQHRAYDATNAPSRVEWYDDRVEFYSPGALFGLATQPPFGSHSDYRNPTVTSLLAAQGYVQQLGRGIRRAAKLLEQNGNPPMEVGTNGFVRIVVRRRP